MKRHDAIMWEEAHMLIALVASKRSKDPETQVGANLVKNNKSIGTGYNGFPYGCDDDIFPWERNVECFLESKYTYVVHAEINAILNSTADTDGSTLYITLFPCNICAGVVIQAGVKEIVYLSDKYHDREFTIAARKMFDARGVKYRPYKGLYVDINLIEK